LIQINHWGTRGIRGGAAPVDPVRWMSGGIRAIGNPPDVRPNPVAAGEELRAHSLKHRGWYMIDEHGHDPPIGPFDSPEECIMAMRTLVDPAMARRIRSR
jgi:hypothetical protein